MSDSHFALQITDPSRARLIAGDVFIGQYFVFTRNTQPAASPGADRRLQRLLVEKPSGQPRRRVMPMITGPVVLPGVAVTPAARRFDPLACVITDRDLYRAEQDTAQVFIAIPGSVDDPRLVVEYAGQPFAERALELSNGSSGVAIEPFAMLLPGPYTAQLMANGRPIGQKAGFTVAEYTLAPLTGRLLSHRIERQRDELVFELEVESYQVPFGDSLLVALVDGGQEVAEVELDAQSPGRYAGALSLARGGDGPFRLRLQARSDSERVAEVAIPGSRKRERDTTVISELGQEMLFSMMPEPGALPVRGGHMSPGDVLSTPLTVPELVTTDGVIDVRADVEALFLAHIDLDTGEVRTRDHGDARAGSQVAIETRGPATLVVAGCFVNGQPFEGYTTFLRPTQLALRVAAPQTCRPRDELVIELGCSTEKPIAVLLSVRDQRLTASDNPDVGLGAAIKAGVAAATDAMAESGITALDDSLRRVMAPLYHSSFPGAGLDGSVRGTGGRDALSIEMLARSAPGSQGFDAEPSLGSDVDMLADEFTIDEIHGLAEGAVGLDRDMDDDGEFLDYSGDIMESEAYDAESTGFDEATSLASDLETATPPTRRSEPSPTPRSDFPEILFHALVPVTGQETVRIPLGDSLGTFAVEAFALTGADWVRTTTAVVIDQPVRVDLELPPAVHPDDHVIGRLRAATASGRARLSLTCDGQPVALRGVPGDFDTIATPVELELDVAPGHYVATVEDPVSGELDTIELDVEVPGKFRTQARQLGLLQAGDAITLDSADALGLRVLPALEATFDVLLTATAGYAHLCCEQTAAKILSASFMYLASTEASERSAAEQIILAGITREARMLRPGEGFSMYPGTPFISEYYSTLAVRYLWTLDQLERVPDLSSGLRRAVRQGIEMADQAGRAHGMTRVPTRITCIEDAYAAVTAGTCASEARAFIDRAVDLSLLEVRPEYQAERGSEHGRGAVARRSTMAYAAASLAALGEWKHAIPLANQITRHFNDQGRMYSTVDSVAAIALMVELRVAGIASRGGRLRVNGQAMSVEQAVAFDSGAIESIEVLDGVAAIEVTRMIEEDWTAYAAGFAIKVGFRDSAGNPIRHFRTGNRADLVISLQDGYQEGDLLHIALPACMSWIRGGGKVKRFTLDFEGQDELHVPVIVTSAIHGTQRFAACVRNMFEEERAASPGLIAIYSAR